MKFSQPFPAAQSKSLPAGLAVLPRKPLETEFEKVPRFYVAENRWLTMGMDIFSLIIPEHERFFIETVREYADTLKDEEEKKVLRAFIQQEAIHLKIHDDFNETRKAYGINVARENKRMKKGFAFVKKWLPLRMRLGMTVFMEHVTASASHLAVKEDTILEHFDPTMATLWQWHAVEELEHKSVAFDLFKESGGGYFMRLFSAAAVFVLDGILFSGMAKAVRKDMEDFDLKTGFSENLSEEEKVENKNKVMGILNEAQSIKILLFQYFKPSFYPWEIDESERVEELYSIYGS